MERSDACRQKLMFFTSNNSNRDDDSERDKHMQLVRNHHFNHSVSILMPGISDLPLKISPYFKENPYYVVENLALESIVEFNFLEAFVRRGSLMIMSINTLIDVDFCFCLLPTGLLVLNTTKDDYEGLGLEGKPSYYYKKTRFKYVVHFDLKDANLTPSSKKYLRLKKCLSNCSQRFDAIVSWVPPSHDINVESIRDYFIGKNYKCETGKLLVNDDNLKKLQVPKIDPEAPQNCFNGSGPDLFYEWLGAVTCGCSFGSSDSYENTLMPPESCLPPASCLMYTARGFFTSETVAKIVEELRNWCSQSNSDIPWVSITIHGFTDCPVAWYANEHGLYASGDNNHTIVVFPKTNYKWSFITYHPTELT